MGDTFDDLQKQLQINIPCLYSLHILIGGFLNENFVRCEWVGRTFGLIMQHWPELIELFVCDLYSHLCAEILIPNYRNSQPTLFEIVDVLVKKKSETVRQAIQGSTVGEERFKRRPRDALLAKDQTVFNCMLYFQ